MVSARIATGEHNFEFSGQADECSTPSGAGFISQLRELVGRQFGRLALGCLLDFSEAAGYYGLFSLLPLVVLPHLHVADETVPWFFIIGNVGAAIGGLVATMMIDKAGRKATVMSFYLLAAMSMLVMGRAAIGSDFVGTLVTFTVANLCATGSWIAPDPTFLELFPTRMRATGIGFSVAFGRFKSLGRKTTCRS